MATAAQTRANRSNAQKSTGPRTAEGKAVVAQNAVKHGLLARAAVLQGEDWEEFTELRENLLEELSPEGRLEGLLAERIVSLSWRRHYKHGGAGREALGRRCHLNGPGASGLPCAARAARRGHRPASRDRCGETKPIRRGRTSS